MKTLFISAFSILTFAIMLTSCKNNVKDAKTTNEQTVEQVTSSVTYKAIPNKSMVFWKANKIVGGHEGYIYLSEGTANVKDNNLVGGKFTFDIMSLKCTDIPEDNEDNKKLVDHLLSEDFFNAEIYNTATFEITSIENNTISGNLTLKGITKNVTVPSMVKIEGDKIIITSDTFKINRTEWDINYNSGKIMDANKLGDYLIKDDVELKINVTATKI